MSEPHVGVTKLPTKLIALCLSKLDEMRWLKAASIAHRAFHTACKETPSVIIDVLRNQIPLRLISFALSLRELSKLENRSNSSLCSILDELYLNDSTVTLSKVARLSISDALQISKTHTLVQSFCDRFAGSAFSLLLNDRAATPAQELSCGEEFRICRGLYRAELYWTLFDDEKNTEGTFTHNKMFFDRHSPWVNEQLACIHDFLEQQLCQSYNEVAAHDVEWGELGVQWLSYGEDDPAKQYLLSRGLEFLSLLFEQSEYDARLHLLFSKQGVAQNMLAESLLRANTEDDSDIPLKEYTTSDLAKLVRPPEVDDLNSGPFHTWHWAHIEETSARFIMCGENSTLRRCGYVMWDQSRALKLKDKLVRAQESDGADLRHGENEWDAMIESFSERSEIWQKGGKGYWTKGDLSKITWARGPPPGQQG